MKAPFILSSLAFLCSLAALGISLRSPLPPPPQPPPDPLIINRLVDEALQRKEEDHVRKMWPKMQIIYKDMLGPEFQMPSEAPKTLHELYKPFFDIMQKL